MSGSVPVVEKVSFVKYYSNQKSIESHAQGFDFVECPGGPVPRLIRLVFENDDPRYPDAKLAFMEWRSEDIGKRAPTEADFLVPVSKDVIIAGLQSPDVALHDGKLDISGITLEDLSDNGIRTHLSEGSEQDNYSLTQMLVVFNLTIISVLLLLYLIKRARKKKAG